MSNLIKNLLSKCVQWGLDQDGDLTMSFAFIYFTFYKWGNGAVVKFRWDKDLVFVALGDDYSKDVYHAIRKQSDEVVALEIANLRGAQPHCKKNDIIGYDRLLEYSQFTTGESGEESVQI